METTMSRTSVKTAVGKSTGKVILMGEHAVVHHQPAIAIPFSGVEVQAHVQKSKHPLSISCEFYSGVAYQMPEVLKSLKFAIHQSLTMIQQARPELAIRPTTRSYWRGEHIATGKSSFAHCPYLHIEITSSIPAERGMGSSAAVAVAIVRGLFAYYNEPLTQEVLYSIVQDAEKIAHGNPSGVDTTTTSGKSPVYFVKGKPIEEIELQLDAVLVVADTGMTGHTKEAVQAVQEKLTNEPQTAHIIHQIGHLTQEARMALEQNRPERLGELMTQNHHLLQQLDVSNQALDSLVTTALQYGALGAKVTGGGRGGCMIALARNLDDATTISQALAANGAAQTWHHVFH